MNNYPQFKRVYIETLTEILNDTSRYQVIGGGFYTAGSPSYRKLTTLLADLEELHPIWTERVEDWLADEQLAKGFTYHLQI
jgi:hypothetical protein